jgi:hypothetical protein
MCIADVLAARRGQVEFQTPILPDTLFALPQFAFAVS